MTQPPIHTFLVTAELDWASSLYRQLSQQGFAPLTIAPTGESALELLRTACPRLVLVDQRLPDWNGLELCVELLQLQPLFKVVLVNDEEGGAPLTALQAGLAGCVARDLPLASWSGLLLYILNGGLAFQRTMIDSVLSEAWSAQKRQALIRIGHLQIDLARRLVVYAGRRIQLTPREFALFACLARNKDLVVPFEQFLTEVWGYEADDGTQAQVRLYVARLRQKLIDAIQLPDCILTERGIGYRLHSAALHRLNLQTTHHTAGSYTMYSLPSAA
jgi:DNA-binding response OmpR family regulator